MKTSSEAKHTPGPWVHVRFGGIVGGPFYKYANGEAQSQVASATVGEGISPEEREANARLIAAAPDLLEALRTARQELRFHNLTEDGAQRVNTTISRALAEVDAAIAAATGEQS